jgi:hypothetical protein
MKQTKRSFKEQSLPLLVHDIDHPRQPIQRRKPSVRLHTANAETNTRDTEVSVVFTEKSKRKLHSSDLHCQSVLPFVKAWRSRSTKHKMAKEKGTSERAGSHQKGRHRPFQMAGLRTERFEISKGDLNIPLLNQIDLISKQTEHLR